MNFVPDDVSNLIEAKRSECRRYQAMKLSYTKTIAKLIVQYLKYLPMTRFLTFL